MFGTVEIVIFLALLTAGAFAGFAVLSHSGLEDRDAWAVGRIAGPALVALPAWWAGSLGFVSWPAVGGTLLFAGGVAGIVRLVRRGRWGEVLSAEAVFIGAFLAILMLRSGRPAILQTEKLMDLGILATLLRAPSFPPSDMWLAGESLPYYYWGSLVWALPMRLAGLRPDVGYNLVVALVGGASAAVVCTLGAKLAGGRWVWGVVAALFALFAGTADGVRQLLAGADVSFLDLWASSRQVPDTITEFPLFTLWLGDLHPHLLSLPLSIAAIFFAAAAAGERLRPGPTVLSSVFFGLTWAANPWAMPPTLVAVGLMLVAGDGKWRWPDRDGRSRWLTAVAVGIGGWAATAPFHLAFDPPSRAIKTAFAWTRPTDLALFAAVLLIPVLCVVIRLLRRWGGSRPLEAHAFVAGVGALAVVAAAATGRPTMVLLSVGVAVFAAAILDHGVDADRPALALAVLGLSLFLVPEMVYLDDGYGAKMHRMNTVFKAYFQGWLLLSVALPVLVRLAVVRTVGKTLLWTGVVILALPHLLSVVLGAWASGSRGFDGLTWMDDGDRAIVEELRRRDSNAFVVEAVGDAYSEYARLSSASGVPAFLGWANHEFVWRGEGILAETGRREEIVRRLYSSADPYEIAVLACENGIGMVAIGALEKRDFSDTDLEALREAGREVLDCGDGGELVLFAGETVEEGLS